MKLLSKKKLNDLRAQRGTIVNRMHTALDSGDFDAFDAAQAELDTVDAQIMRVQALIEAEGEGIPAGAPLPTGDGGAIPPPAGAPAENEVRHAFCEGIRAQWSNDRARFAQNAAILQRAAAAQNATGMNEGTPADGGLIVPEDVQTTINQLKRALNPLSDIFRVENVGFLTGSRVIDTHPTAGFTKVAEFGTIARDDKPAFSQISYKVEDYALILPVSNDLLRDTDEALLAYVSDWFSKKSVITENKLLLSLLSTLDTGATTAAAGSELAAIKTAMNVTLDPAISMSAGFLTNQDGFNYLDSLVDTTKRPLLQPDPTSGTRMMLLSRPVTVVSNAVLPSNTTKGRVAPLYVGDFSQYGTLFRRQALEIRATDIGGNAWVTNSTEVRGIMRLDAKTFDTAAATAIKLTVSAS